MHPAMGEVHRQNYTLKDNVNNIRQNQGESNPLEKIEVLDPKSLLYEIWGTYVPEGFKPPSRAKFDG